MKKKIVSSFFIIAVLIIAVFVGIKLYQKLTSDKINKQEEKKNEAVPVEITAVKKKNLRDMRNFTGTLKPWTSFYVAPKISGRLNKLTVSIGDPVKKGQLLAHIEDQEFQQQVNQARAELRIAEAQLEESRTKLRLKEKELKRLDGLFSKNVVSEADFDTAESQYKSQLAECHMKEAQLAMQQAVLKTAEVRLSYAAIYAVWDEDEDVCYIGQRFIDPGAMLDENEAIMSIINIKRLKAAITVIERDYPYINAGQQAWISTDAYPGQQFKGKISRISKVLDERTRQAEVQVEIPNDELKLKPGMFVRVEIEFARHKNAQTVPRNAVVERDGKTGVFRVGVEMKKAFFVPIVTGITTADEVEIISPEINTPVVTLGHHLLTHGASIILPGQSTEQGSKAK